MTLDTLIDRLAPVVYPTLCERYRTDCCIAGAAILMRVFEAYGYQAEAVSARLEVYNEAMVKLLRRGPLPRDREQRRILFEYSGAWGVGTMPDGGTAPLVDRRSGGYGGHLLLRVNQFLVDPTAKQADRADKQIVLPQMIVSDQAEALARDGNLFLFINDCTVVYRLLDDQSYRTAPDWQRRTTPYPETVHKILERIK